MQGNKRARGRGRKSSNQINKTMDSNGPDVKIRGTASHIYEKYQSLARDANASGDKVAAENYLQHAEHYFRLMAAMQAANQQAQPQQQPALSRAELNGHAPVADPLTQPPAANGGLPADELSDVALSPINPPRDRRPRPRRNGKGRPNEDGADQRAEGAREPVQPGGEAADGTALPSSLTESKISEQSQQPTLGEMFAEDDDVRP